MVCIGTQDFKHPLPNAFLRPAAKAGVDHPKVPKALRQVAPGDACTIAVKYRLNEQAVVACSDANGACPSRQMVFDAIPGDSKVVNQAEKCGMIHEALAVWLVWYLAIIAKTNKISIA